MEQQKEAINQKIREEYDKGKDGLEVQEHHRLDIPLQTVLEQFSLQRKQRWLDSVCLARNIPKPATPPPTSLELWLRASGATNLAAED